MPSIAPLKSRHKIPLPGPLLEQWNGMYLLFKKQKKIFKLNAHKIITKQLNTRKNI